MIVGPSSFEKQESICWEVITRPVGAGSDKASKQQILFEQNTFITRKYVGGIASGSLLIFKSILHIRFWIPYAMACNIITQTWI
ncbi:MAG TPA: hypothetical protein VJ729_10660 [Nitrososphaeraceae archaeon]|jgi:hypothetical protein|nr:hypothetical protein [Nitrososphaeraceae archaeon]